MKRIACLLTVFVCLLSLISFPAAADTGPKAAVHIRVEGLEKEAYATLLSKNPTTGPHSAWNGDELYIDNYDLPLEIWQAFRDYGDEDGYYFLQIGWELGEKTEFTWGYYPPSCFKVLLYFPESGSYAVSDICQRYAFDTYYTVSMADGEIFSSEYDEKKSGDERLIAFQLYNRQRESFALLFRMALTVLIEGLIALCFGFRKARALLILVAVNLATQILLNTALNLLDLDIGRSYLIGYFLLELAVFVIEALAYVFWRGHLIAKKKPAYFFWLYAGTANLASLFAGVLLADVLPYLF